MPAAPLSVQLARPAFSATVVAMTTTLIAKRTRVTGTVDTEGDVMVEGRVEGSIRAGGSVTIGVSGVVVSDVQASQAIVLGILIGNLRASERVDVAASARIVGDVRAPAIALANAHLVEGRVEEGPLDPTEVAEPKPTLRLRGTALVRPAQPSGSAPPVAAEETASSRAETVKPPGRPGGQSRGYPPIAAARSGRAASGTAPPLRASQPLRLGPPPTPGSDWSSGADELPAPPIRRPVSPTEPNPALPPALRRPTGRVRLVPRPTFGED
jgi:cytoskeletal protein CcmA (bactofilin family)